MDSNGLVNETATAAGLPTVEAPRHQLRDGADKRTIPPSMIFVGCGHASNSTVIEK